MLDPNGLRGWLRHRSEHRAALDRRLAEIDRRLPRQLDRLDGLPVLAGAPPASRV